MNLNLPDRQICALYQVDTVLFLRQKLQNLFQQHTSVDVVNLRQIYNMNYEEKLNSK
ncbi:unnamed protein product (macronuclear) [Paramecium tetraurelia]|uniref:Uncharacterized protein n=1 Tax=Paramecium tetraurelia TaxID=5888 RepID=A0DRW4_PARTE|nr:uncharacterized protein GSPATT00019485001 [Paramecium tetraurelia]CAK85781.1 unnamed protein product [Paramecium tetraurelia]|eukprot:XP_001453178.1 hypothetical protein (macronuclear) [Paramecium tetraurelia strain d4-2]